MSPTNDVPFSSEDEIIHSHTGYSHWDRFPMNEMIMINLQSMTDQNINLKEILNKIELVYIKTALEKCQGVVSHAAEKLGVRRTTLIEKMKKLNIEK